MKRIYSTYYAVKTENIEHFILDCERLEEVSKPILQEIEEI